MSYLGVLFYFEYVVKLTNMGIM